MLNSSAFGPFDPLNPGTITGSNAKNIYVDSVEIDAPIETVWEIMTGFDSYPEWNPLNRFFKLETEAMPDHYVTFGPSWGPYDRAEGEPFSEPDMIQREMITIWEEKCCLAYADIQPTLNAERVQHIFVTADGKTCYHTYERLSGKDSPAIIRDFRDKIIAGFTANGEALKKRAEAFV